MEYLMNKKARAWRAKLQRQLETICGGRRATSRNQRLTIRLLTAGTNADAEARYWVVPRRQAQSACVLLPLLFPADQAMPWQGARRHLLIAG